MKERSAFRAAAVAAVAAAIVILLGVTAVPGIGDATSSHGGPPSDVFTSTEPGVCSGADPVHTHAASLMPTAVSVGETSHVVVYFTSTWSGFRARTALVLTLQIEGDGFSASSPDLIDRGGTGHAGGTVMWAFDGVAPGDYTVRATARLAGRLDAHEGANLQGCALTVLVTPAVE